MNRDRSTLLGLNLLIAGAEQQNDQILAGKLRAARTTYLDQIDQRTRSDMKVYDVIIDSMAFGRQKIGQVRAEDESEAMGEAHREFYDASRRSELDVKLAPDDEQETNDEPE